MPVNISTLTINAPLEKVWDVLTKPALVKQWQYGSELVTDWKAGSTISWSKNASGWKISPRRRQQAQKLPLPSDTLRARPKIFLEKLEESEDDELQRQPY